MKSDQKFELHYCSPNTDTPNQSKLPKQGGQKDTRGYNIRTSYV